MAGEECDVVSAACGKSALSMHPTLVRERSPIPCGRLALGGWQLYHGRYLMLV
jgi:hypothetical protein